MMLITVPLVLLSAAVLTHCRSLVSDLADDINSERLQPSRDSQWAKISRPPKRFVAKTIGFNDDVSSERLQPPADNQWVKISQPPKRFIAKTMGSHLELSCEVMGSPPPKVQWLKDNNPLTEMESVESNGVPEYSNGLARVKARFVINYLLPIHQGEYTCVAQSGQQIASATSKLIVNKNSSSLDKNFTQMISTKILGAHHTPRITLWAQSVMEDIGKDLVLPCRTVGNPIPNLVWIDPDSNVIGRNEDERISVTPWGDLSIKALKWNDMGVYNCIVKNSVGEDSIDTFLYPLQESE